MEDINDIIKNHSKEELRAAYAKALVIIDEGIQAYEKLGDQVEEVRRICNTYEKYTDAESAILEIKNAIS